MQLSTSVPQPTAAAKPARISPWLSGLAKAAVAAVLITWMIKTGRLDIKSLAGAFRHKGLLLGAAALCYGQIFVTGIRWHLLLISQGVRLKFKDTLALNMIGTLFNTVIPGAVGGDVMKGYYLSRRAPGRRTQALTTLLIDRVVGLLALLLVSILAASWNSDLVRQSHGIQVLLAIAAAGLAAGVGGFAVALVLGNRLLSIIEPLAARFRPVLIFQKVLLAIIQYQHHKDILALSVLISLFNHGLGIGMFYLCAQALGTAPANMNIAQFLLVVPAWTGDNGDSDIAGRSRRRPGCVFYFVLVAAGLLGATWIRSLHSISAGYDRGLPYRIYRVHLLPARIRGG